MKYTTIFEKISCLGNLITTSVIYPVFLLILLLLIIMLSTTKKKSKKIQSLIVISYVVLFAIIILNNYDNLEKLMTSISNNFFTNIYFPSVYTYLFILVTIDLITILGKINTKLKKSYQVVNGVAFGIINFILVLILDTVAKNSVDVFSKKSLFTNSNLLVLLESSVNVYILWLITLLIIYLSDKITERLIAKEKITTKVPEQNSVAAIATADIEDESLADDTEKLSAISVAEPTPELEFNELLSETQATENNNQLSDNLNLATLEEFSNPVDIPAPEMYFQPPEMHTPIIKTTEPQTISTPEPVSYTQDINDDPLLNRLLNNELPIIKEEKKPESIVKVEEKAPKVLSEKDTYTLNDYKTFNKILKDIRTFNNSNIIKIDRSLDMILKAKYTKEEYSLFQCMLKTYSN